LGKNAVQDGQDMLFGGTDEPCALATLTSLGAINKSNNENFSAAIAGILEEHGVPSDRYYVNFFDVPRENCAYRGATFA
jgi:phenylpyruvate tautomerase